MDTRRRLPPTRPGFTLVELMVVVAVLVILAAMAWPAFTEAIQKSRRADGMAALANIMQSQERWRANNPTYQGSLADLPGAQGTSSPDRHYSLSIVDGSATAAGYTAQATVSSGSPQTGDHRCQVLRVAMNGGLITYSSLASGGSANGTPDPCWVR